jgi:hypothetical protein
MKSPQGWGEISLGLGRIKMKNPYRLFINSKPGRTMGKLDELKARVWLDLTKHGFISSMNYRFKLNYPARGYMVTVLDVVIFNPFVPTEPVACVYVGPTKSRKLLKFRLTGLKIFEVLGEADIKAFKDNFWAWYAANISQFDSPNNLKHN